MLETSRTTAEERKGFRENPDLDKIASPCDRISGTRKITTFMEITVGITGASGAMYAHRTLLHLAASGTVERINLILSESARTVAMVELGFDLRSADEK
jgi:hypothetical protein